MVHQKVLFLQYLFYIFLKKANNYVTFDIPQASTIVCLPNYNSKRPPNTKIQ